MGRGSGLRAAETISSAPQLERSLLQRPSIRSKLISMICLSIVSLAGVGTFFVSAINEVKVSRAHLHGDCKRNGSAVRYSAPSRVHRGNAFDGVTD